DLRFNDSRPTTVKKQIVHLEVYPRLVELRCSSPPHTSTSQFINNDKDRIFTSFSKNHKSKTTPTAASSKQQGNTQKEQKTNHKITTSSTLKTNKMLRHLLSSFSLAVLLYSHVGGAEKTWLSKFPKFPEAKSLEVVHFVTVKKESTPTMFVSGPVQLVDAKTNARIFDASQMKGLGLAVLSHSQLVKLSDTGVSFCDKDGAFTLGDAYSWTLADLEGASASKVYKPVSSGLYYVVQTNCAEKNLPFKFSAGELSTTSVAGWLPGEESPKLAFYFYLLVAYVGLLAVWGVWCKSWADVLFNIHHYITVAILAGLLEAACW
ncbi:unnamed protein product, partial [Amoebophrya sp. A25]